MGRSLWQLRERDFVAHYARAAAVQISRVFRGFAFGEGRMQELAVELRARALRGPASWQQAVVFYFFVSPDETRRVIAVGVFHQLFVDLDLLRRRDRMVLAPEVRLSRAFLVAVSPDVLGIENLAFVIDNESGFVGRARRPDDLRLLGLRIDDARIHHIELDERAPESDAAREAVPGLVRHRHFG